MLAGVEKEHEEVVALDAVGFLVGRLLLALGSFGLSANCEEVDLALETLSLLSLFLWGGCELGLGPSLLLTVIGA